MACPGTNLAKRVKFCGRRRAKELVPGIRPNSQDAGKPGLDVAKFNRAKQGGKIRAEGPNNASSAGAWLQGYDQKDRGARKRSNHCLRDAARAIRKLWTADWFDSHKKSPYEVSRTSHQSDVRTALFVKKCHSQLTIAFRWMSTPYRTSGSHQLKT